MSSTSRTRSPGSIRKPRRNSRLSRPVVGADLLGEDRPDAKLAGGLEGEDDPAGRGSGDEVDEEVSPSPSAAVGREEAAQLAGRGRILEDLELLDVRVAVATALEEEMALAERARAAGTGPRSGARSCAGAAASRAGRTVVMRQSLRGLGAKDGRVDPADLGDLRRIRDRP